MRLWKTVLIGSGLALAATMPAHAAIYDYTLGASNSMPYNGLTIANVGTAPGQPLFNADLKIDTTAGTGTLIGDSGAINIAFTGNFSGFTGGSSPMSMYNIVINPASSITYAGNTYSLVNPAAGHPDMLSFDTTYINFWAEWTASGCSTCKMLGDIDGYITGGGTPVPEPGMIGLMGLGVAGLVWQRRRKPALRTA